ncbi:MAG: geranylgeranyl reductase family protein [Bacteroidia bacterium]|jgi:geranylgeranyl reductase family protein
MTSHYNIIILGAGPAGASCALALKDSGLTVAMIDKAKFPRDKPCGDAIPGPCLKLLRSLIDDTNFEPLALNKTTPVVASHVYTSNGNKLEIPWKSEAYNATRIDFDSWLVELVKLHTKTSIYESVDIRNITNTSLVQLEDKSGKNSYSCDILIACDGANSLASRKLLQRDIKHVTDGYAIRAYYKNVVCETHTNEFFLLDEFKGYFWIFPLSNNLYNVGVGLLKPPKQKSFDLKKAMINIIKTHPVISQKFKHANKMSNIHGFRLPLGGKPFPLSGDRFMLAGDAGHLIDPLQGHGIDKAMESGILAAKQAQTCFEQNKFNASSMSSYDKQISVVIGSELKRNMRVMKVLYLFPWLINFAVGIAERNKDSILKLFYKKKKNVIH